MKWILALTVCVLLLFYWSCMMAGVLFLSDKLYIPYLFALLLAWLAPILVPVLLICIVDMSYNYLTRGDWKYP